VDALTPADLLHIACGKFPTLAHAQTTTAAADDNDMADDDRIGEQQQQQHGSSGLLERMIQFNRYTHHHCRHSCHDDACVLSSIWWTVLCKTLVFLHIDTHMSIYL
jgi:hypothetical protein